MSDMQDRRRGEVFVIDHLHPEDVAMLQALYSRSGKSAREHLKKVEEAGSGKFMESYYVGYGHASIGDCGSTTLFAEGVSMLVAKAIQDWALYAGQESSSRYIDMNAFGVEDPLGTKQSKKVLDTWMDFYNGSQPALEAHLRAKYPIKPGEKEGVYDRAIKARVFDILRAFLPAGARTQLSWHTNLRQAHDKLALLRYYPLKEVRDIAEKMLATLKERYQHSFNHKEYPEQEAYRKAMAEAHTFYVGKPVEFKMTTTVKRAELAKYAKAIKSRPIKTNLPNFLAELGTVTADFLIDFGSFRDVQRHRNGVCRMPLLTTRFGFNEWYLEQLPTDLRKQAQMLIRKQKRAIAALKAPKEVLQYYIAMGFNVTSKVTYGLPAAVYTMELRSGKLVHPTLRKVALKMYSGLAKMFPELRLHADLDQDDWDIRRGTHDIVEKK